MMSFFDLFKKKVICKGCGRELKPNWKLCPDCKTPVGNFNNLTETRHLVWVEGGEFNMGSEDADEDEKPVHRVRVDSFYMSKYQLTQKLWKIVMGNNPSKYKGDARPVESVNWYDAIRFCNALSEKDGLECCYNLDGDTNLEDYDEDELDQVECDFSANGYRLPTEAEWEYAARGGVESDNASCRYPGSNDINNVAWYWKNSGDTKLSGYLDVEKIKINNCKTHPVGSKLPNELGIYDMSGNVGEWCNDRCGSNYYSSSPSNNPTGPNSGSTRVTRGGAWAHCAFICRVAFRGNFIPFIGHRILGFRILRANLN